MKIVLSVSIWFKYNLACHLRSQCDVPEQLLAEALLKKVWIQTKLVISIFELKHFIAFKDDLDMKILTQVQSPANSDGLVNELEGVAPLTDVNLRGNRWVEITATDGDNNFYHTDDVIGNPTSIDEGKNKNFC